MTMCVGPDRKPVLYMRRMPARFKQESGWVLYSGEESDEFADDWRNFIRVALSSFVEHDPSLRAVIESPVGSQWTRSGPEKTWRRVISGKVEDETGKVIEGSDD